VGRTASGCEGCTVVARRLALIVIAQKSREGAHALFGIASQFINCHILGRKRWERGGCEGRMGWDLLVGSCAGGRSDRHEAMNKGKNGKNVEDSFKSICG
jgi:hypothetical protein